MKTSDEVIQAAKRNALYYQSHNRNNNNPFQVTLISVGKKFIRVKTQGEIREEFLCRLSSLYTF